VAPADRAAVRKFLSRFRGQHLEVALEATTGWRFVVEELRGIGVEVHLAEPAETAGLRGPKKRAKGDRADARHLRELLMIKRLPESWIPPITSLISAPASGCGTRSLSSAGSGSSGSRRRCITTAARSAGS
jgi:transposase